MHDGDLFGLLVLARPLPEHLAAARAGAISLGKLVLLDLDRKVRLRGSTPGPRGPGPGLVRLFAVGPRALLRGVPELVLEQGVEPALRLRRLQRQELLPVPALELGDFPRESRKLLLQRVVFLRQENCSLLKRFEVRDRFDRAHAWVWHRGGATYRSSSVISGGETFRRPINSLPSRKSWSSVHVSCNSLLIASRHRGANLPLANGLAYTQRPVPSK